jgi:hypothetical protein
MPKVIEMWSWAAMGAGPVRGRRDDELARFARLEYGSNEIGWLLAESRQEGGRRFWARVRSFIVHHLTRRTRQRARSGEDPAIETSEPEVSISPTIHMDKADGPAAEDEAIDSGPCSHLALEYLGSGGGMSYRKCLTCGHIIITQRGCRMMIPATER